MKNHGSTRAASCRRSAAQVVARQMRNAGFPPIQQALPAIRQSEANIFLTPDQARYGI